MASSQDLLIANMNTLLTICQPLYMDQLFILTKTLGRRNYFCSHSKNKEFETQRCLMTYPRSHN